jgi:ribonuclease Z
LSELVQARLVNPAFDDPGLILDFRHGARAILFDLGNLHSLSTRELGRVEQVFVSHLHVDHFVGFDHLLRLNLHRPRTISIVGPPGLTDGVEAKLRGYHWNLLNETSPNFVIQAADWLDGFREGACFAAQRAFRREPYAPPALTGALVHAEDDFAIHAAALDHGIPSLAFAFVEARRVNVIKQRLDVEGLPVGAWLTEAKRAIRGGRYDSRVRVNGGELVVSELLAAGIFREVRGQHIAYATDFANSHSNRQKVLELARDAHQLFIEAVFADEDAELAMRSLHQTARQAGLLAREAGVHRAMPMHFSPRYLDQPERLAEEFLTAFKRG